MKIFLYLLLAFIGYELHTEYQAQERNFEGYCESEGRKLTDDELKIRALEYLNKESSFTEPNTSKSFKRIPYASVSQLLEENPNCCSFSPLSPQEENDLREFRYYGHVNKNIHFSYKVYYQAEDGSKQVGQSEGSVLLNNCGRIWGTYFILD